MKKLILPYICSFLFFQITFAQLWIQVGSDIDGEAEGDFSGCSVALSSKGCRVAIGATHNYEIGDSAGHGRIYSSISSMRGHSILLKLELLSNIIFKYNKLKR